MYEHGIVEEVHSAPKSFIVNQAKKIIHLLVAEFFICDFLSFTEAFQFYKFLWSL